MLIITALLFTFMVTWLGMVFECTDEFWSNLRRFSYRNRSAMEVAFIFIYAFEQTLLIGFTFTASSIAELGFIISIFAIIVLTTFSLHKLVMESRIKLLEQEVHQLQQEKLLLESYAKEAKNEFSQIFHESMSKGLNISKLTATPKNERR